MRKEGVTVGIQMILDACSDEGQTNRMSKLLHTNYVLLQLQMYQRNYVVVLLPF